MGFRYDETGTGSGVTFAPPAGQIDLGDVNSEGASGSAARADHQHALPSPTGAPPALAGAGAAGGSARPSRQDHTHAHTAAQHLGGGHADLSGSFAAIGAPGAAVAAHEAAADPHPGYQLEADALAAGDVVLRSLVDAKGDLVVGTAADTVARLARGADGTFLVADSSAAAGLKFAAGPEAGVTDHGALTGLADNDHPQYLLTAASPLVVKSANESVASSIVLQDDDELFAPLEANTSYAFELMLRTIEATTTGLKVALTVPTGAALYGVLLTAGDNQVPEVSQVITVSGTGEQISMGGVANHWVIIKGSVRVGATAGNLRLQWAQSTSNATPTTVEAGSTLELRKAS